MRHIFSPIFATLLMPLATAAKLGSEVPSGRPVTPTTDYHEITPKRLLTVFKGAYIDAGFRFKQKVTNKGGSIDLIFEYPLPKYRPGNGLAVISFRTMLSPKGDCAPCSVHRKTLGIPFDYKQYDGASSNEAQSKVFAADAQANVLLKTQLGKNLSDVTHPMAREPI